MRRDNIYPSLLSQGQVVKGTKDENDKNLRNFTLGIGRGRTFSKEVGNG